MYISGKVRYRRGYPVAWPRIIAGPNDGLGQEADCPEPVSTAERDEIVRRLNERFAGHVAYAHTHWAEGHPDLRAIIDDIWARVDGLKNRPKLLRCSAEARTKAELAIADMNELLAYVKRGDGATIIHGEGFWFRSRAFPPMRPYFVRGPYPGWGGGPKPPARGEEQFPGGAGILPARGSVSASGAAPTPLPVAPGPAPAAPGEVLATPGLVTSLPSEARGVVSALTEGELFGIPKRWLLYGVLGLAAFSFLKRR